MMKSNFIRAASLVALMALPHFLWVTNSGAAEGSTAGAIAIKTPLKSKPSLIGGGVLQELEPGALVNVLSTKSTYTQVALADDSSVKGWVLTATISKDKNITSGLANMNSAAQGVAETKTKIAGSVGSAAKGIANLSAEAQAASNVGRVVKGKAASLKDGLGAVAKGKQQALEDAGTEAIEDAIGADVGDVMNAATSTVGKFKGKSASTLEKIESLKISDTEISGFMKEGGLRSRLIR